MMTEKKQHPFEKGLERLEEISSKLDSDDTPLEEAIRLYEEGIKLSASLTEYLADADRRILAAPKREDKAISLDECTPLANESTPAKKTPKSRKSTSKGEESLF
jgi:exodeoxyribonuclease VII small subunit